MSPDRSGSHLGRVLRFPRSLRAKVVLMGVMVVFVPLVVVWSIGVYEALMRRRIGGELVTMVHALQRQIQQRGLSVATLAVHQRWLQGFARRHQLMIQVVDAGGAVVHHTPPRLADSWHDGHGPRRRGFFFGPAKPPDLLAHEESLPSLAQRKEVIQALGGEPGATWRYTEDHRMWIFYRAVPITGGALYCIRISRRNVRALYDFRYPLLQLTLVLAAGVAVMALWIGLRFVRPMTQIQRAIRAHLEHPAEVSPDHIHLDRSDEIGLLSHDVQTLARSMQAQLQHAMGLAAELAHDLKNPIATVRATAELLETGTQSGQRQARLAAALTHASEHMNRSVEGLLRLARLDHELATQPRAVLDLSALTSAVLASFRQDPRTTTLTLTEQIEAGVHVLGIREQLETLLRNLLDNAVLFGRNAVVALHRDGTMVHLSVEDDGPGIPEGNQDKVFRRFFTARPDDLPAGTGLGLTIARTIATAHRGELVVQRGAPGARLVLVLPATRTPR